MTIKKILRLGSIAFGVFLIVGAGAIGVAYSYLKNDNVSKNIIPDDPNNDDEKIIKQIFKGFSQYRKFDFLNNINLKQINFQEIFDIKNFIDNNDEKFISNVNDQNIQPFINNALKNSKTWPWLNSYNINPSLYEIDSKYKRSANKIIDIIFIIWKTNDECYFDNGTITLI